MLERLMLVRIFRIMENSVGLFTLFSIIRKKVISSKAKMNAHVYNILTSANLIDANKQIMTK